MMPACGVALLAGGAGSCEPSIAAHAERLYPCKGQSSLQRIYRQMTEDSWEVREAAHLKYCWVSFQDSMRRSLRLRDAA
jgi:hypothetical protein